MKATKKTGSPRVVAAIAVAGLLACGGCAQVQGLVGAVTPQVQGAANDAGLDTNVTANIIASLAGGAPVEAWDTEEVSHAYSGTASNGPVTHTVMRLQTRTETLPAGSVTVE